MADILITDDEPESTNIIEILIRRMVGSYEIRKFTCPIETIKYALSFPPLLVVCDYRMVGLSGLDVAQILRDDPRTNPCRFILVPAHSISTFLEQVRQNPNVDDFVTKPYSPLEITKTIRNQLAIIQEYLNPAYLLLDGVTFNAQLRETIRSNSRWTCVRVNVYNVDNIADCRRFGASVRTAIAAHGTLEDYAGFLDENEIGIVTFSRSPELILKHLTTEWEDVNIQMMR